MIYDNTTEYVMSLQNLSQRRDSLFPFREDFIRHADGYYIVTLNTSCLFAGDRIQYFHIFSENITKVSLCIDNNITYIKNYEGENFISLAPFTSPINILASYKSTMELYIHCDEPPTVKTYYTLMDNDQRLVNYNRQYTDGDLSYMNGYAGKIFFGQTVGR